MPPPKFPSVPARTRRKGVVQTLTSLQTRRGVGGIPPRPSVQFGARSAPSVPFKVGSRKVYNYSTLRLAQCKHMALRPRCDRCRKELKRFGGLLFSPPDKKNIVKKYHLCISCYRKFSKQLRKLK